MRGSIPWVGAKFRKTPPGGLKSNWAPFCFMEKIVEKEFYVLAGLNTEWDTIHVMVHWHYMPTEAEIADMWNSRNPDWGPEYVKLFMIGSPDMKFVDELLHPLG